MSAAQSLQVVGVSLGASRRDHRVEVERGGRRFQVERRGTDGDLGAAEELIRRLDGQVDAIGLGGIDIHLRVADAVYPVADGVRLRDAAHRTPVVDGSGVKDTLERWAVQQLAEEGSLGPRTPVLCVSALDRFGMAQALEAAGCPVVFGDLMFAAGVPYPIRSTEELARLARRLLPEFTRLPFGMLYPTGKEQEAPPDPRFASYYEEAKIIAGDFHYIRRYLPPDLKGKWILTNTTTAEDVQLLKARGAARLITTTPVMEGRSFGTNVIEAMVWAYLGSPATPPEREELAEGLRRLEIKPEVRLLG